VLPTTAGLRLGWPVHPPQVASHLDWLFRTS
jgi:hypothetical protein